MKDKTMTDNFYIDSSEEYRAILDKNNIDYYEWTISKHFVCALEYGDTSGLSESDIHDFNCFMLEVQDLDKKVNHFDYKDTENSFFTKDAISTLYSDCVTVFGII